MVKVLGRGDLSTLVVGVSKLPTRSTTCLRLCNLILPFMMPLCVVCICASDLAVPFIVESS